MRPPSTKAAATSLLAGVLLTYATASILPAGLEALFDLSADSAYRTIPSDGNSFGAHAIYRSRSITGDRWMACYPGQYIISGSHESSVLFDATPPWVYVATEDDWVRMQHPYTIETTGTGWPFRAFSYVEWVAQTSPSRLVSKATTARVAHLERGKLLAKWETEHGYVKLVLPFKPIWAGFLADVVIWSVASGLTFAALTRIRAAHRKHRNRCPHCNYSRAGLALSIHCPECGRSPTF